MTQKKINVRPGVPVDLVLAYTEGKPVNGAHMMFSTVDQRVLFVPIAAGHEIQAKLRDLGVQRGERILVCEERTRDQAGQVSTRWNVFRTDRPVGEQADGTFVVPSQPGASAPPQPRQAAQETALTHSGWARLLQGQTNALIDVYAAALAYSHERYGDQVSPADVRALLIAAHLRKDGCEVA